MSAESIGEASDSGAATSPLSTPPSSQSPASWTHDTSRARFHMKDLASFAQVLEESASRAFPNRGPLARYKSVQVLLLRWKDDDLQVCWEVEDLEKALRNYGFQTEIWLIPTETSHRRLMMKAGNFVDAHESRDTLFIVYYGGHATINPARQSTWSCKRDIRYASLEWSAIQTVFEQSSSDVLLLLDCCAAASAAPPTSGNAITETIAACGWESIAAEPGRFSFTDSLIRVLEDWVNRPFTAAMLHSELLSRLKHEKPETINNRPVERRRTPIYIVTTANVRACSIQFSKLNSSPPSPNLAQQEEAAAEISSALNLEQQVEDLSLKSKEPIPQVLISLSLEENQTLDRSACCDWLAAFPALATHVTVQGVYQSHSTLLLILIPVTIWDLLPENPACAFIGYVRSDNLLQEEIAVVPSVSAADEQSKNLIPEPLRRTESTEISINSVPIDEHEFMDWSHVALEKARDKKPASDLQQPTPLLLATDLLSGNQITKYHSRRKSADSGFSSASNYSGHLKSSISDTVFSSPIDMRSSRAHVLYPRTLQKPLPGSSLETPQKSEIITLPPKESWLMSLQISRTHFQTYIGNYWAHFDKRWPIIHRASYNFLESSVLDAAMASIGSQYTRTDEARKHAAAFSEFAMNEIKEEIKRIAGSQQEGQSRDIKSKTLDIQTMQAIFLIEYYMKFSRDGAFEKFSRPFEDVQRQLAEDLMSEIMADLMCLLTETVAEIAANAIPARSPEEEEKYEVQFQWRHWINFETSRRLASACFVLDMQHSIYHGVDRSRALATSDGAWFPYFPCPDDLWHAVSAAQWDFLQQNRSHDVQRVSWPVLQKMTLKDVQSLSKFSLAISIMAYVTYMPPRKTFGQPSDDRFSPTLPANISEFTRTFRGRRLAATVVMFNDAAFADILSLSLHNNNLWGSDTHSRLYTWSRSIQGARAARQARRLLLAELTVELESEGQRPTRKIGDLSDYWVSSFAVMVCLAFSRFFNVFRTPAPRKLHHSSSLNDRPRVLSARKFLISMRESGNDEDRLDEEEMRAGALVLVDIFDLERWSKIINEAFGSGDQVPSRKALELIYRDSQPVPSLGDE